MHARGPAGALDFELLRRTSLFFSVDSVSQPAVAGACCATKSVLPSRENSCCPLGRRQAAQRRHQPLPAAIAGHCGQCRLDTRHQREAAEHAANGHGRGRRLAALLAVGIRPGNLRQRAGDVGGGRDAAGEARALPFGQAAFGTWKDVEAGKLHSQRARKGYVAGRILEADDDVGIALAQPRNGFGDEGHAGVLRDVVEVDLQAERSGLGDHLADMVG